MNELKDLSGSGFRFRASLRILDQGGQSALAFVVKDDFGRILFLESKICNNNTLYEAEVFLNGLQKLLQRKTRIKADVEVNQEKMAAAADIVGSRKDHRWSLHGLTALVTGGTEGIGNSFFSMFFFPLFLFYFFSQYQI
ncbi:hypothetical protein FEM48_Zijuj02G0068800 [Ziziphus jujuba var. spinosa]|uniref:Uncharacterized protein n=1 Tax=Ziziphus jujuba var. spinosa TaxID=714518 RepID=A0A978VU99_ZIZJJ|nr:hypothetical protein FEM48_Zijuj02G0068800 [Ziziphus jujuba var. spinosa]